MNFRRISQLAVLCLAICSHAAAQVNPGSSFLFQLPGAGSAGTRLLGYFADTSDLNPDLDVTNGPAGASKIIATPDGQRVYVVAGGGLQVFNASLQTLQPISAIAGPIRNIEITPDGKYLLVAATQFYVLSTANNTIAATATTFRVSGQVTDFAISPDSQKAWLLQSSALFGSIIPINLVDLSGGTRVDIPRSGDTITLSPQGRLYVPTRNNIAEYDATTLLKLSDTVMSALPGRLRFNADGTQAYFVDLQTTQGYAIVAYRPATQQTFGWPSNIFEPNRPTFDEIYFAGTDRIFALDRIHTTLWEITGSPLSAAPVSMPQAFDSTLVYAAAVTNEIPSARFLYILTENSSRPTVARVNLANGTLQTFANAVLSTGILQAITIPPQTGASQIVKFNDNQVLTAGGKAKNLLAYVTDSLGRPIYNQAVTFTNGTGPAGAAITNSSEQTNSNGYVQTSVTLPDAPGNYTINLTAGTATTTFTLTVPTLGGGTGGDGGDTGSRPRISVVRGDGQLVNEFDATAYYVPITVKVVDPNGDPQPGVQVDFNVTQGSGSLIVAASQTDSKGLITATFLAPSISSVIAFEQNIVRATSPYGSVDISEVIFRPSEDRSSVPIYTNISTPDRVNVRRGDVTPNLFSIELHSGLTPQIGAPVPGVGLRIADGEDLTLDGPGTCVNDTKSDNLGVSRCDYQTACSMVSATRINILIGEVFRFPIVLIPLPGSGQKLTYVSGNNQTGSVGQALTNRLNANITDNCGDPVANQNVTWTVTQGTATLSQIISKSGADGNVSAAVTLGQTAGIVKVSVSVAGGVPVVFNLTATVSVSSITLTGGGGQSALSGDTFPTPIQFTLRTATGSLVGPNVGVNFALTGSGTLSVATATTNTSGQVQVTVIAGPNPGTITVTATYLTLSASATLTVRPPTLPLTAASFANAASGVTGLVPCGLATAVGAGLVPTPGVISGIGAFGPLPYQLGNVNSLLVNNVPAPIQAVSNQNGKQQINFQVPCETAVGNATVVVTVNNVATTVTGVPVFAGQPGIFTYAGPNNKLYGAVLRVKDGSYITPSNYAPTGESFYLILTGLGSVTPATATNSGGNNQAVNLTAVVGVANAGVPTQTARYLQGSIGVYYIEFTIPKATNGTGVPLAPGTVVLTDTPLAVFLNINGQPVFSQPGVLLPGVVQGQ